MFRLIYQKYSKWCRSWYNLNIGQKKRKKQREKTKRKEASPAASRVSHSHSLSFSKNTLLAINSDKQELLFRPSPKGVTHHRPVRWVELSDAKHDQHGTQKHEEVFAHSMPWNLSGGCIKTVPNIHVKVPVHLKNRGKRLHIYQQYSSCSYLGEKDLQHSHTQNCQKLCFMFHRGNKSPTVTASCWLQ